MSLGCATTFQPARCILFFFSFMDLKGAKVLFSICNQFAKFFGFFFFNGMFFLLFLIKHQQFQNIKLLRRATVC